MTEPLYQTWDGRWLTRDECLAHCEYTIREAEFWAAEERRREDARKGLVAIFDACFGWLVPLAERLEAVLNRSMR